tara:strand:- start:1084 stop:1857 length:774 start_codon:yes stop_codon:yes gene_type:complete
MSIKKITATFAAIVAMLIAMPSFAIGMATYPQLTNTQDEYYNWVEAVQQNRIFAIKNSTATAGAFALYLDDKEIAANRSTYSIAENPAVYKGLRQFAGETCAAFKRQDEGSPYKQRMNGGTPLGDTPQRTPFRDQYDIQIKNVTGKGMAFDFYSTMKSKDSSPSFPMNRMGFFYGMGKYNQMTPVLTVNMKAYLRIDGANRSLYSDGYGTYHKMILPEMSKITGSANERSAYNLCYNQAKLLMPLPKHVAEATDDGW